MFFEPGQEIRCNGLMDEQQLSFTTRVTFFANSDRGDSFGALSYGKQSKSIP